MWPRIVDTALPVRTIDIHRRICNPLCCCRIFNGRVNKIALTHYSQEDGMSDGRGGRYLALVKSGILALGVPYLQRPLFGVGRVQRLETLVARVGVTTDRQQVNVSVTDPRYLNYGGEQ